MLCYLITAHLATSVVLLSPFVPRVATVLVVYCSNPCKHRQHKCSTTTALSQQQEWWPLQLCQPSFRTFSKLSHLEQGLEIQRCLILGHCDGWCASGPVCSFPCPVLLWHFLACCGTCSRAFTWPDQDLTNDWQGWFGHLLILTLLILVQQKCLQYNFNHWH